MPSLMVKEKNPTVTYLKDYQVPAFFIDEVHLKIELLDNGTTVLSRLKVRKNQQTNAENNLMLDGDNLNLISIALNNVILSQSAYQVSDDSLIIKNVPDQFELTIETHIFPEKNTALSGLYRSRNTYCTQCEAEGFRRITYFMDRPDILAHYTTTIIADKSYPYLLSNGNLIGQGELENNRHYAIWQDPFKKPSYLFALVAGDFDLLEDTFITQSKQRISLRIFVEKGYQDQAQYALYSLKAAMEWDEKTYGREYDLDNYMIVAINDFNMGAMENKGLNIFNTKYILAKPNTATDQDYMHILSVVGHEYFHNWSGNRVTCRDWFQLSLKEGLTIFRDQHFSEDMFSKTVMRIREVNDLREVQFAEDASPLAHSVCPDSYLEINNFYTATIYNKGSEVLRMMRTILGKTLFRQGMDLYFSTYDGQAVTIEDFVHIMETVSGIDLTQFRRWYHQAGTPILTVRDHYDAKQKIYALTIDQTCPATPGQSEKLPLHIPLCMGLLNEQGEELTLDLAEGKPEFEKVLHIRDATQTFKFKNISSYPIPSLLRDFSAPVKIHYPYTDANLLFLTKNDSNSFNRYEMLRQYYLRIILRLIADYQANKTLQLSASLIDIFSWLLTQSVDDQLLLADMLALPSEKYISEQMSIIDVNAIHHSREFLTKEIGKQLQTTFYDHYQQLNKLPVEMNFNIDSASKRHFKNICLHYLMQLPEYYELGWSQFEKSINVNMTDTLSALIALANSHAPQKQQALAQFYTTYQQDALVIDKWLAIQAMSKMPDCLAQVKKLFHHEAFDVKNPNKVYALLGTFTQRNLVNFHAEDGEAYIFLGEKILELDRLNPHMAARMVKPLINWKKYDEKHQQMMRQQLTMLSQEKISTDLYELVTKSL